jgi:hypothetical protein
MATFAGIAGHDHELPDLSADGFAERAELDRSTLAALDAAEAHGPREQSARAAMRERLAVAVERYDAGDITSDLNVAASRVQDVRELFDLMPTEGEEAAVAVAARMAAVPEAYRQFSQTLLGAARNGRSPARLQVEGLAKQCAAWAAPEDSAADADLGEDGREVVADGVRGHRQAGGDLGAGQAVGHRAGDFLFARGQAVGLDDDGAIRADLAGSMVRAVRPDIPSGSRRRGVKGQPASNRSRSCR